MRPDHKSDIIRFLKSNKDTLSAYGVKKIGLFGSFVRESQKMNSDIDLLVEFDPDKLNYTNFIQLAYFLEDNLNTKIDLVTSDSLSPYIGPHILKEVEYVSL
jgi:predicted nucleotidyltransferase